MAKIQIKQINNTPASAGDAIVFDGSQNVWTAVAQVVDRVQKLHVGKHGSDTNDGLTPEKAFLTLGAAITAATAATPSASNQIRIVIEDGGIYTESATIPSFVRVDAPGATLSGNLVLSDETEARFYEIVAASGNVVSHTGTSEALLEAGIVRATGSANALANAGTTGVLQAEINQLFVEDGIGVQDGTTLAPGHSHIDIEDLYITGTGTGIDAASPEGRIVGRISHLLEIAGGVGNGTGIEVNDGVIDLQVGRFETTTAYNASAGILRLIVNNLTGTRNQTSGAVTVDVLEANSLRWIFVENSDSPYVPRRIEFLNIDTTGGAVEIDLPATASDGDAIYFQDATQNFGTNSVTFDANGNTIDGVLPQLVVDVDNRAGQLVFNAANSDWSFSTNTVGVSPANLIYVSKNGSDVSGDGSFDKPFLTVKKGVDTANVLATVSLPVSVNVLDGIYDEDPITASNPYVTVKGNGSTVVTIRPNQPSSTLFSLSSTAANIGATLTNLTLHNTAVGAGTAVLATGDGRFVLNDVPVIDFGVGIDAGNGTISSPNAQEFVYDFGILNGNVVGAQVQDQAKLAIQVSFFRNNDTGLIASDDALVEIGNYEFQGSEPGDANSGTGIVLNDNADLTATSGRVRNFTTGLIVNDSSTGTFGTTFFDNTTDFNQVDATAQVIMTGGSLNKDSLLIADGANVALDYFENTSTDFIVGSADSTADTGKEFRVRQTDGRIFIGDNATNAHGVTGTVGGSRSVNLIDENGNIRIWRFTDDDGQDPSIEWVKGINPSLPDGEGDTAITNIDAATDTITIDVSGAAYNEPLDATPGISRSTLAERAFPAGREIRVNGTASNNADYVVSSSSYNSGPQTIDIVVTTDITVSEGAGGEVVWGGGAGRPDGVSTYSGDPGAAVGAGTGNVRWDMFLQEDDYLVFRHRTGGGGGLLNEKVRLYPDRSEWLGATTYGDGDNSLIAILQATASATDYLQISNAASGTGPQLLAVGPSTDVDLRIDEQGNGNVVISGLRYPNADGTPNQVLATDGAGNLFFKDDLGATAQDLYETFTGNTGSSTASSPTDSMAVVGGTGISTAVTTDTITITNDSPNVDQNLFETVAGDTGSTTADSTTDTLTIAGGTGVDTSVSGDTVTVDAQVFISTIGGEPIPTFVDSTRSKTLSVESNSYLWAEAVVGNNDWIQIGTASDADSGYIMPFNATIVGAQAHTENANGNTKNIDLFIGNTNTVGTGTTILTLSGTGQQTDSDNTLDIDLTAGDKIRLRGGTGGSIQDTVVTLRIRWRA